MLELLCRVVYLDYSSKSDMRACTVTLILHTCILLFRLGIIIPKICNCNVKLQKLRAVRQSETSNDGCKCFMH